MPTGYTAILQEKPETSVADFIMRCARAFGALVSMRDEPMDAPIPERFEPSDYNAKKLEAAKAELTRLQSMEHKDLLALARKSISEEVQRTKEYLGKDVMFNAVLDGMALKIAAWQPPTPDHRELKDFMLNQIRISRESTDYYLKKITALEQESTTEHAFNMIAAIAKDIEYHEKAHAEEVERTEKRNRWIADLRASLPIA